ncbi:MAG TPA: hypothetical protein VHW67_06755 [Solirubrobacteraceae bacterium]|nr:hypothetical protein [Solirubrobacteraceae bacterium]
MASLVVADPHVEGAENLCEFVVGGSFECLSKVGHGVEHRQDFVGVMPGGPLLLESFERVRDGSLASAQLHDALRGERDYWVGRVLVLL